MRFSMRSTQSETSHMRMGWPLAGRGILSEGIVFSLVERRASRDLTDSFPSVLLGLLVTYYTGLTILVQWNMRGM